MASIIRIKRSSVSGNPATLAAGELAYSALTDNGSNGGDRLYIGIGTETSGNAANHFVIGGKYFTDMMDHSRGTLTASSAILVDANSKIDNLKVDNLDLNGNTISSTDTNGNIVLSPNGNGYVSVTGTNGIVIPVGNTIQRGPSVTGAIRYNTQTSQFEGYSGANWASLGGVRSVDGLTYISAELNPGDSDDTIRVFTNGTLAFQIDDDSAQFESKIANVNIAATTASTSTSTGALTVAGGVGIGGALYVNGAISAQSASFASINNTPIGNTTPSTGAFTQLDVDNIRVDGNTISSTNSNGDINITPAGTGRTIITNIYTDATTSLTEFVQDITGGQLVAGEGIDITYNDTTGQTTIDAELATISNRGVASFDQNDFVVTDGAVSIKTAGVGNSQLENSSVTVGSTTISLGGTSTTIAGLTQVDVNNIRITGNEISSTNTNGNISLNPNGSGTVEVNNSRITGLATPSGDSDAATKLYVDTVAEGLSVKPAVRVATTENLVATYNNGTNGIGATLTLAAAATLNIDGVTNWSVGNGILVKNQTNAFENGRYFVSTVGNISTPWVLTRCGKCDEPTEIPSMYIYVQEGATFASTGWVAVVEDFTAFDVGVDDITFIQFSGAGTYLAGNGLTLTGSTFDVVGTANRITVTADAVDIASTYVGQTSITTLGTIGTGTWQGTIVSPTYGGTGINNGTKTITLGGNLETSGAFSTILTVTGNTSVTLPTSGTLATLAGTENLSNKTITSSSFSGTTVSASGNVTFTSTTDATALGTAPVVLSGGLSVAKSMFIGINLTGAGAATSTLDGFNIDGGTY